MGNENEEEKKTSFSIWWILRLTWEIATVLLLLYVAGVALVLYSTTVKMEIVFANRINTPWFANLSDCRGFGLVKCTNHFVDGPSGKLGSWLISPASKQYISREAYILYFHGNSGSRALSHRVELYKKLSKMGYHIFAIDYRGFGDSEGFPTEVGLLEDGVSAYNWLHDKVKGHPIYIWGHSLGSSVAVRVAQRLNAEGKQLNGLILEAAFNNLTDGIKRSPLAFPASEILPDFDSYIQDVYHSFRTSFWIQKVTSPIMMLHDKEDHIIDINLGRKLFLHAKQVGSANVQLIELNEHLYHNDIYKAKNLKHIMREFVRNTS